MSDDKFFLRHWRSDTNSLGFCICRKRMAVLHDGKERSGLRFLICFSCRIVIRIHWNDGWRRVSDGFYGVNDEEYRRYFKKKILPALKAAKTRRKNREGTGNPKTKVKIITATLTSHGHRAIIRP